jgi:hypothetical protein
MRSPVQIAVCRLRASGTGPEVEMELQVSVEGL